MYPFLYIGAQNFTNLSESLQAAKDFVNSLQETKDSPLPACLITHAQRVPVDRISSKAVLALIEGRLNKFG